jgi:hypothetical protein
VHTIFAVAVVACPVDPLFHPTPVLDSTSSTRKLKHTNTKTTKMSTNKMLTFPSTNRPRTQKSPTRRICNQRTALNTTTCSIKTPLRCIGTACNCYKEPYEKNFLPLLVCPCGFALTLPSFGPPPFYFTPPRWSMCAGRPPRSKNVARGRRRTRQKN